MLPKSTNFHFQSYSRFTIFFTFSEFWLRPRFSLEKIFDFDEGNTFCWLKCWKSFSLHDALMLFAAANPLGPTSNYISELDTMQAQVFEVYHEFQKKRKNVGNLEYFVQQMYLIWKYNLLWALRTLLLEKETNNDVKKKIFNILVNKKCCLNLQIFIFTAIRDLPFFFTFSEFWLRPRFSLEKIFDFWRR